jgi:hypothetical protein
MLVLAIAAGSYVLAVVACGFLQKKLLFVPVRLEADVRFPAGDERWIEDDAGKKLDTLFFVAAHPAGTIVYFHGNAGNLLSWGPVGDALAQHTGFNVWMLDYPGYGKSEGELADEAGLYRSAAAIYRAAVRGEHGAEDRVVVFGRSLGTGLAIRLAAQQKPGGLILEAPYDSMSSLASSFFPWAPSAILRYPLRSDLDAPQVHCPALLLHGEHDEVVPFRQGARLARRIPGVTFMRIPEGHHNDLARFPAYWSAIDSFLARWH